MLDWHGTGTVTVNGLLTWTGGRMLDAGRTVASGGMAISGAATKVLDSRILDNAGAATWTGAGNVVVNNGEPLGRESSLRINLGGGSPPKFPGCLGCVALDG